MEGEGWGKMALMGPTSPTGSQKRDRVSDTDDRYPIYRRPICAPPSGDQANIPNVTMQPHPAPTSRTGKPNVGNACFRRTHRRLLHPAQLREELCPLAGFHAENTTGLQALEHPTPAYTCKCKQRGMGSRVARGPGS